MIATHKASVLRYIDASRGVTLAFRPTAGVRAVGGQSDHGGRQRFDRFARSLGQTARFVGLSGVTARE